MNLTGEQKQLIADQISIARSLPEDEWWKPLSPVAKLFGSLGFSAHDSINAAVRIVHMCKWFPIERVLEVEQRSIETLVRAMDIEDLPDGRQQLHLREDRALEKFTPRSRWSLKDTTKMRALMAHFYTTPYGLLSAQESIERGAVSADHLHPMLVSMRSLWADESTMLISAQDSFVDLLEAAAITAPDGPLGADELLSESGVLLFEKERVVSLLSNDGDPVPIRGLAWKMIDDLIMVQVFIDGHRELANPSVLEPPVENYAYLYVLKHLLTETRDPTLVGEEADDLLKFLRAVKQIAQANATKSTDRTVERRVKKGSRVVAILKDPIRVLSLTRPDHGSYELDAATGRRLRQHWVRGHWRNQWYATLNDHRSIWIEGFVKGNADIGTVTGSKVYVARAPRETDEGNAA